MRVLPDLEAAHAAPCEEGEDEAGVEVDETQRCEAAELSRRHPPRERAAAVRRVAARGEHGDALDGEREVECAAAEPVVSKHVKIEDERCARDDKVEDVSDAYTKGGRLQKRTQKVVNKRWSPTEKKGRECLCSSGQSQRDL